MNSPSVALRLQGLPFARQVLVLGRVVSEHAENNSFAPQDVVTLMETLGLPEPGNIYAAVDRLKNQDLVRHANVKGRWRLTPTGLETSLESVSGVEGAVLLASEASDRGAKLGSVQHGLLGPELAPLSVLHALVTFLRAHPFETNVFGMTRFPDEQDASQLDPVKPALDTARRTCARRGLEFHLASDRSISDDLWGNVAAHMWACKYGIAFFEDRQGRGINYNLTIEVGAMLMTGRRCALLKDTSISAMPTDLVGHIYKPVDLDKAADVEATIESWIEADLGLTAPPASRQQEGAAL